MGRIALTFGDSVRSYPLLANNPARNVQKAIRRILERTVNEVLARLRVPDKDYNDQTGRLRSGFRRRRSTGYKYKVWNNTPYASFIENGTRYITARKMLHRELANGRARLRRRLEKLVQRIQAGERV